MFLGWDIGIKNLAYCLIDFNEESKETKIIDWGIINLIDEHILEKPQCTEIVKSTKKQCTKKSDFISNTDESICYCKTHFKKIKNKEDFKEISTKLKCSKCNVNASKFCYKNNLYYCTKHIPCEFKQYIDVIGKKANRIPILQLGKRLFVELDKYSIFSKVKYIVIENQPVLKNPTMKSIQMMLYSYFIKKNIIDANNSDKESIIEDILLMSARNKLKVYNGEETDIIKKINNTSSKYIKNKKLAIEHCKYFIEDDCKWLDFFNNHKKKDDLSDAYLMTKYYINKKYNLK